MTMSTRFKRWLKGLSRSLTVQSAALIAVAGYFQTQGKWLTKVFGEDTTGHIMMLLGLLMVLLRIKTTESLESKGSK